jgi:drug/metabolite transporter (DMT)-like permease
MIPTFVLLSLVIAFLWGIQPVIHKYLLKRVNAITIMLISSIVYLLALLITLSFSQIYNIFKVDIGKLTTRDFLIIILTSVFTVFLANMIYYYILKDNETSIIVSLIYSAPVFTLLLSYLFLKEKIEPLGIIGICLIISGVGCVSLNNNTARLFDSSYDIE